MPMMLRWASSQTASRRCRSSLFQSRSDTDTPFLALRSLSVTDWHPRTWMCKNQFATWYPINFFLERHHV